MVAVSSCPVFSSLALFWLWVIINKPSFSLININIHCATDIHLKFLKDIVETTCVANRHRHVWGGLFWAVQDEARRDKIAQCVALRRQDKARMLIPGFEKYCTYELPATWNLRMHASLLIYDEDHDNADDGDDGIGDCHFVWWYSIYIDLSKWFLI